MRELTQIDSPAEHECTTPSVERWNVLEPVSGRWSWLTVFGCCARVAVDANDDEPSEDVRKAA
ncbi:MAG TPA: hypothetical protein VFA49_14975 [Chloroflexota bacterium]|jgi:hypothetical protein|nr:hypothetical protein [Chloroflexota bacterium]